MTVDRRPIATERMVLEPIDERHSGAIHAAAARSLDHLLPWMPWAVDLTAEQVQGFNREAVKTWTEGSAYGFALLEGGVVVGVAGISVSHGGVGELAYWVAADAAGRGLATEAGRALLEFGFGELGLYRVELRAGVENVRSLRVAEKLGFAREGTLRNGLDGAGGPFDTHMFGMTPEDWVAQRP